MVKIEIIYAVSKVMAFKIDLDMYYIKFGPNHPKIYDSKLQAMVIPNLDSWIQAKTHQKYSLVLLEEMSNAFIQGMLVNYSQSDVMTYAERACKLTIDGIMKNGVIYDYSISYWIEILSSDKIEKYLSVIAEKLDYVVGKMGYDKLVVELNRIRRICVLRQINARHVCEKLLERLDARKEILVYPETAILDAKVRQDVQNEVMKILREDHRLLDDGVLEGIKRITKSES